MKKKQKVMLSENDVEFKKLCKTVRDHIENETSLSSLSRIHKELSSLIEFSLEKVMTLNNRFVYLLESQDVENLKDDRHVSAKFLVGPKKKTFEIVFDVENSKNPQNMVKRIDCELFNLEDSRFIGPDDCEIEDFLENIGLADLKHPNFFKLSSSSSNTSSSSNLSPKEIQIREELEQTLRHKFIFAQIFNEMILIIHEKHGKLNKAGIDIGCDEFSMYSWLDIERFKQ